MGGRRRAVCPRLWAWPAMCAPLGQGRAPHAPDLPGGKPLAPPRLTSGDGVKAAAPRLVPSRTLPPPNLVPITGNSGCVGGGSRADDGMDQPVGLVVGQGVRAAVGQVPVGVTVTGRAESTLLSRKTG